jgi:chromate transporter
MEEEVVRRRGWLTREAFLDYVGATNLIPGPNSTELAIHIGHARAGWRGLIVAGVSFIAPATAIVGVLAWAYVRFGALPAVAGGLYGMKPVVVAIVVQALWLLGRLAVKTAGLAAVTLCAVAAVAAGVNELVVLLAAGAVMGGAQTIRHRRAMPALIAGGAPAASSIGPTLMIAAPVASGAAFGLWPLFLVFAKIGSVLFGSGYVLLAFLRTDLVQRLGWLTERQLLDATAAGQITPGPVFTTATFIGYLLGGPSGAAVATLGIFLPAFIFVAISAPLIPRLRQSPAMSGVLDGVNVASLALMAVVSWQLGRTALIDPLTIALALVSLIALVGLRVNSTWLILAAGVVGAAVKHM